MTATAAEAGTRPPGRLDFPKLAQYLRALANENRLEILHRLQAPKPASELRLAPGRQGPHGSKERTISRVAVKDHLASLAELGLVRALPQRGDRGTIYYVLNHQKLFAVIEELRALGLLQASGDPGFATLAGASEGRSTGHLRGPRLIVVHGRKEGHVFALAGRAGVEGRGWVIGRRQGLDVSLDYDPFVSGEHAEVVPIRGGHALLDLRTNVNGTLLNWTRLPRGGDHPLTSGDVIGVGKSLLLFRSD